MKKNSTLKKPISINPETIRLMSSDALPSAVGGSAYTQLYYSCRACGSLTKFC